jgi:hypothetical protein
MKKLTETFSAVNKPLVWIAGIGGILVIPAFLPMIANNTAVAAVASGLPDPGIIDLAKNWYTATPPGQEFSFSTYSEKWLNGVKTVGGAFAKAWNGDLGNGVLVEDLIPSFG